MYADHLSPAEEPRRSGEPLLQRRRRHLHLRRAHAAAGDEGAARRARQPDRPPPRAGAEGHPGVRRHASRSAAATTHCEVAQSADVKKAIPTLAGARRLDRRSRRCAISARSAARSPTTTRRPTIPPRCWRSPARSTPTSGRSRPTSSSPASTRRRWRRARSSPSVAFKVPAAGGLREVPQPGLALSDGRRVRREAQGRLGARRGDRRRQRRRLPLEGGGGGAGEEFLRRCAEGPDASTRAA